MSIFDNIKKRFNPPPEMPLPPMIHISYMFDGHDIIITFSDTDTNVPLSKWEVTREITTGDDYGISAMDDERVTFLNGGCVPIGDIGREGARGIWQDLIEVYDFEYTRETALKLGEAPEDAQDVINEHHYDQTLKDIADSVALNDLDLTKLANMTQSGKQRYLDGEFGVARANTRNLYNKTKKTDFEELLKEIG